MSVIGPLFWGWNSGHDETDVLGWGWAESTVTPSKYTLSRGMRMKAYRRAFKGKEK